MDETQSDSAIAAYRLKVASTRKYMHTCTCVTHVRCGVCGPCDDCTYADMQHISDLGRSSCHIVKRSSLEFHLRFPLVAKTSTTAVCEPVSHWDVRPPFYRHRQRFLLDSPIMCHLFRLGPPKIAACILAADGDRLLDRTPVTVWVMITFKMILCYKMW